LQNQSFKNFEWLIVDDGSTDGTYELVEKWIKEASFKIKYVWQENKHKKAAFNHGVSIADGELFLTADSDDEFASNALERFYDHWQAIPANVRNAFVGVCSLCKSIDGEIVGDKFPCESYIDSDSIEMKYRYKVSGEKWGFSRTDVLKKHPFPESIPGFVPEGIIWANIAKQYKTRFVNESLRTYRQDSGNQLSNKADPRRDALGLMLWSINVLNNEASWFFFSPARFIYEAARWNRLFLYTGFSRAWTLKLMPKSRFAIILLMSCSPIGFFWWLIEISLTEGKWRSNI
jgi:glycosyltransferase involved in cell wall biosynthesis